MTVTVLKLINDIRTEMIDDHSVDAYQASDRLLRLTALLGNINEEIQGAETEYIAVLNSLIDDDPKLAVEKVKIKAQSSEAYQHLQSSKRTYDMCVELIQALKYRIRVFQNEERESRNL